MVWFLGEVLLLGLSPVHPRCDVYLVLRYEYQVFDVVTCPTGRVDVLSVVYTAERRDGLERYITGQYVASEGTGKE